MRKFFLKLIAAGFLCVGCSNPIANLDSQGENIICFGDSLTEGVGAAAGEDYPSLLRKKIAVPVINAGMRGETTVEALLRLENDVLNRNPRLVIVEFGGNDFMKRVAYKTTFENLDRIVERITQRGAIVVLAAVRIGLWKDDYYGGFNQIAKKHKAVLIPNVLKGIMDNPSLKYDQIHPNAEGYKIMAERVYKTIQPLLNP